MKSAATLVLLTLFALVPAAGCGNPAADAPAAVVGEAGTEGAHGTMDAAGDSHSDPAASSGEGRIYEITDASTIGFVGSKITGSHDGGFRQFDGEIRLVDGMPEASHVEVNIDTTSLWSDNEKLTGHLKSPDFFDVAKYPTARFASKSISPNGDGTYTVSGQLDLHGVTKSVSFPATISVEEERVTASAEFSIKRFDWGIEYRGAADNLIRDEVLIKLDLQATPASQA